ncbi:helix-turn-helix transcriptional regulator [Iningainema tapete]|uniref:Helix-turn-helix transcriptional regulator n=1 Tax=Iningainema tapete BLCC-T55 TaxID=2748662 RepID=A0A8J7BW09_9CYAN|nr:AraC family transcriptional regulator [Iningainema tapete]MBD2770912.1 helix-turn-helix transcriptional regulator [Iningainema tapete BLCC-T55]
MLIVDFFQEKATEQLLPHPPILSSRQAGWEGVLLEYHFQPAGEFPEIYANGHGVIILTKTPNQISAERTLDGKLRYESVGEGDIIITPARVGHRACWHEEGELIFLGISPQTFACAVDESGTPELFELTPHFATRDPLVQHIGLALKRTLENYPAGNRLYAETMTNALIVHLLQNYSTRKPILSEYTDGLSRRKLQQVIDYINTHLDENFGLASLSALVQISPHYFSKLFKKSTGMTPHQYVIRCRVERAKELLLKQEMTIAEIANLVGFANQGHLNLHFKRLLGITPKKFMQK